MRENRVQELCENEGGGRPGLLVLNSPYGFCGREATLNLSDTFPAQELCESEGDGRPGLPVHNSPYGLCGRKATLNCSISELWSCVKVEWKVKVDVLGYLSLIVDTVSVDVKKLELVSNVRAQELCQSRGGRPGLPVHNSP